MPIPALDTTIGGASANSYVSLSEADGYFEARLDGDTWPTFSSNKRTQALLKAAKRLDQINWLGARADTAQALAWPRVGVAKRDSADVYTSGLDYGFGYPCGGFGQQYQPTEIPQQVKDAQCEFAFEFLNGFNDGDEAEVKQFSDDKMSVTFDRPRQPGELPAEVSRLISGLTAQNKRVRG